MESLICSTSFPTGEKKIHNVVNLNNCRFETTTIYPTNLQISVFDHHNRTMYNLYMCVRLGTRCTRVKALVNTL